MTPPTFNMASSDSEEYLSAEEEESNKTDPRLSSVTNGLSLTEKGQNVSSKTDKAQSRHTEPSEEDTNVDTNSTTSQEASDTSYTSKNEHVLFTNTKTDSSMNSFEVRTNSTTSACKETHTDTNRQPETDNGEFVSNLDNRYVSEGVEVKGEKVELTEEQIKVHLHVFHVVLHGNHFITISNYSRLSSNKYNAYLTSCIDLGHVWSVLLCVWVLLCRLLPLLSILWYLYGILLTQDANIL